MEKIGLYLNLQKQKVVEVAHDVIRWMVTQGVEILVPAEQAEATGLERFAVDWDVFATQVDLAMVFGGDGTLLAATRKLAPTGVPLLGVNLGHLGFLTAVEPPNLCTVLRQVLANNYQVDERLMLESEVVRGSEKIGHYLALNEVVVTKGAFARLIRLQTHFNGEYFATYPGDGLIIATPTGSTAYSLSAGGPIVNPQLQNLIITPICPHTLSSRSLLIPAQEVVKVVVKADHNELMLTCDGQKGYPLLPEDQVIIHTAPFRARLIRPQGQSFYQVLRTRLHEGAFAEGFGPLERL